MLMLVAMLLVGIFAATWGFLMCFMPATFDRATQSISFAGYWTIPDSKQKHPLIRFVSRVCNCVAGIVISAAGCWFAYIAASEILKVLTEHAVVRALPQSSETFSSASSPGLIAFSIFMLIVGALMAIFPGKAVSLSNQVWPDGRSIKPSAAPTIKLFLRIFGAVLILMATMSLLH
jgi:hypothetical protein